MCIYFSHSKTTQRNFLLLKVQLLSQPELSPDLFVTDLILHKVYSPSSKYKVSLFLPPPPQGLNKK